MAIKYGKWGPSRLNISQLDPTDEMYSLDFADCNIFLDPPLLAHSAKCGWSQVVQSSSTATSRRSRCMTGVLREASVANIARLRAVTEQTHTCINTPPSALHLVWVFHIGPVLTCMWVFCDQHLAGRQGTQIHFGPRKSAPVIKRSTISYSIVSIKASWWCSKVFWESAGAAIWANPNRGCEWALTILTSQIIPCLPQQQCWPAALSVNRASWIPPRPICPLQALAPIWKKRWERNFHR